MKKSTVLMILTLTLLSGCRYSPVGGELAQDFNIVGMTRDEAVRLLSGQDKASVTEAGEYSYRTDAGWVLGWDDDRGILYISRGKPRGETPLALYVEREQTYWSDIPADAPVPAYISYECLFELTNQDAAGMFGATGTIVKAPGEGRTYLLWLYGLYHDAHWYSQFEDTVGRSSLYGSEYDLFFEGAADHMTAWDGWIYGLKRDGKLVRKRPEGGNEETVLSGVEDFRIVEGRIVSLTKDGGYAVHSAAVDGGDDSLLLTLRGDAGDARLVGVMEDWVYYYTRDDGYRLYRTDGRQTLFLTEFGWPGLEGEKLSRDYGPLIMGDWVVYYGEEDPKGLWRISADGTMKEPVAALRQVRRTVID